jgi:hypothetical protein
MLLTTEHTEGPKTLRNALLVATGLLLSAAAATADEPKIQPKAVELLKTMSATLAAAHSMSFTALTTYESPSRFEVPLAYTTISEVTMQRPNQLRVITPADGHASEFYYDGKTMTAFSPEPNLVAVADAPPTLDATLKAAYDQAAIYFPFTDVLVKDPYADIADGLEIAFVIGQSHVVGGTTTDMVAIADHHVFAQIWIGAKDHLPRRIRAVFGNDPARLRHDLELSNWKLNITVPADAFTPTKRIAGARHIAFARPDPQFPPGVTLLPPPTAPAAPPAKNP